MRKAEMRLKLAEISIIQEWSRISLRLRVCLKALTPDTSESSFELPLDAQVNEWSSMLDNILRQSDERQYLSATVRQLRNVLPVRNAIAHGEPGWMANFPDSYILLYTLGRDRSKPRKKGVKAVQPFRLELFPKTYLEPEDAELYSFDMDDMLTMAKGMKALRARMEKLCDIAVARSRSLKP